MSMLTNAAIALKLLKQRYAFDPTNIDALTAAGEDHHIGALLTRMQQALDDPENRQLQAIQALGLISPAWIEAVRKRDIHKLNELFVEKNRDTVADWLERVRARESWDAASEIAVEFITTDTPNGSVMRDRVDGSYGIALDQSLISWFGIVAREALRAYYNGRPAEDWVSTLATSVVSNRYRAPVPGFEETEHATHSPGSDMEFVGTILAEGFCLFVLSHELGHIRLGHFQAETTPKRLPFEDAPEEYVPSFTQAQEFEADAWAMKQLQKFDGVPPEEGAMRLMAPAIYFSLASLAAVMHHSKTPLGRAQDASHPDPWARAQKLSIGSPILRNRSALPNFVEALVELPAYIHAQHETAGFQGLAAYVRARYGVTLKNGQESTLRAKTAVPIKPSWIGTV